MRPFTAWRLALTALSVLAIAGNSAAVSLAERIGEALTHMVFAGVAAMFLATVWLRPWKP